MPLLLWQQKATNIRSYLAKIIPEAILFSGERKNWKAFFCRSGLDCCPDLTEDILYRKCGRSTILTGKEFLWQYIMIDRKIRSVKLQLDSMTEVAKENAMSSVFQNEITGLKNELKNLILESAAVKRCILDRIQMIENDERRQILIKRYLDNKTVVTISKEMFMTYQGIYYHLEIGEKEIEKLI